MLTVISRSNAILIGSFDFPGIRHSLQSRPLFPSFSSILCHFLHVLEEDASWELLEFTASILFKSSLQRKQYNDSLFIVVFYDDSVRLNFLWWMSFAVISSFVQIFKVELKY